jgi:hypothetical protein
MTKAIINHPFVNVQKFKKKTKIFAAEISSIFETGPC